MDAKAEKMRKVLLVASISSASGRDFVSGVFNHLSGVKNWEFILAQDGMSVTAQDVRRMVADGLDGFIVSLPCGESVYSEIHGSGLPCVHVWETDIGEHNAMMRFVANDNYAVGCKAAAYLLSNGDYAAFAFYGGGLSNGWILPRLRGFADTLASKGIKAEVFPDGACALGDWLARLPKPAAVFAGNDELAADVVEAAKEARLSIPRHIALIGVDNTLHEVGGIGLSSVRPGHFETGRVAARVHDGLMEGRRVPDKPILGMPTVVVARASTNIRRTAAQLVAKAREFIRECACSGIAVDDVVAGLGVSRSTLEHRFREVTGQSVRQAIEAVQLAKARHRIVAGRGTLDEVAQACGFSSANRLSHVFKQRFGAPPRQWRDKA